MVSGDALRRAISSQKAEIAARIRKAQGGVPTYFDAFLCNFLDQLASTDPEELSANARTRYLAELQWFENYLENSKAGRLVSYARRRQQDDSGGQSGIRSPERMMSQGTAECLKWKGQALFKTVFDFAIFPMLIWELRPGAVFERPDSTVRYFRLMSSQSRSSARASRLLSAIVHRLRVFFHPACCVQRRAPCSLSRMRMSMFGTYCFISTVFWKRAIICSLRTASTRATISTHS